MNALAQLRTVIEDPRVYIDALLWIIDKRGQAIPFRLNPVQRKLLALKREALARGRRPRFLVLKARRQGITTFEQAMNFWTVATKPNRKVLTLAHNAESTEKVFRIPNFFFDRLDPHFRPARLTSHNKRDLNFPVLNSLYYVGTAGSRGLGRGDTLNRVHWSEVAWSKGGIEEQRNLLAGLTEACSHGEVVLETTANGVGDLFHALWSEASQGQGEWTAIFFPWWEDPTYRTRLSKDGEREVLASLTDEEKDLVERFGLDAEQLAWRRAKTAEIKGSFKQEYPEDPSTCFLVSGSRFFDATIVDQLMKRVKPPIEERDGGQVRIFERAAAGRRYVAGCDVSEGVPDGDFSVCKILDAESMREVAVMRGRWRPEEFARRAAALCLEYNTALLAVERNNHGHSALNTLMNVLRYPNLYRHLDYDARTGQSLPSIGWPTDLKTRPIMLDELRAAIEAGQLEVRDRVLLEECLTFQANKTGKYEAREGCHDDDIIATAIAIQARKRLGGTAVASATFDPSKLPQRVFTFPSQGVR